MLWLSFAGSPSQLLNRFVDPQLIGKWVADRGVAGYIAFMAAGAAAAAIGVPRQLVSLVAGISFALLPALLIAVLSTASGALITFTVSRFFARPLVRRRFPDAVKQLEALALNQPFLKIVVIRFLPLGTNMLTNLAAGATRMPTRVFAAATLLGFIPQTAVFVLIGRGLQVDARSQWLLTGVLSLIAIFICVYLYRSHRARKRDRAAT
ncbi:hypothetical protein AB833_19975 [Chromatiales bacterium (ex Bugula neritina AB1)]|nr:hypothetical protein AB833_19975 [Chromatiales bacterium (ex Bugula neritina AB1)]